ncbi:2-C-methyl-D-erythritol 2,4-cyclodiphosphate synthase [bacterium]|nr:2-C-methyl-D-erythritol 2,4-cyclodiphosphate synthase [bacterium]NIO73562.1 2-C-methyl-D-erythritol 2,4-cyclodiphosphate synthase [bacterium]
MKVGIGYDIHRLVTGRRLVLGGVEIPFEKGLSGHSDADVLTHSICDAILGALGKGDIGLHFPDTDAKYKDISSLVLLGKVSEIMAKANFRINNVDAVIIAQSPHLSPYTQEMGKNVGKVLNSNPEAINIKATTNEGLGLIGQGEGIAAYAIVSLTES